MNWKNPTFVSYLILAVGLAAALFAVVTFVKARDATISTSTDRALEAVVIGQKRNCQGDHKFRFQYKKRAQLEQKLGKAEIALLELFIQLSEVQSSDTSMPAQQRRQATDFIKEFAPQVKGLKNGVAQIQIIPLPKCEQQAERLRAAIERAVDK